MIDLLDLHLTMYICNLCTYPPRKFATSLVALDTITIKSYFLTLFFFVLCDLCCQFLWIEFEDTKGVIRIHKSKKDRQHNGYEKNIKRTNNGLQNIPHKTKDRVMRTPLKTGCELRGSRRASSSCSTSDTRRVTLVTKLVISHE